MDLLIYTTNVEGVGSTRHILQQSSPEFYETTCYLEAARIVVKGFCIYLKPLPNNCLRLNYLYI